MRRTASTTTCYVSRTAAPQRLKVRSLVGLLPLCATTVMEAWQRERIPRAMTQFWERLRRMPELLESIHPTGPGHLGVADRGITALVNPERLRRILTKLLDENEFLGPYGIRSISKFHEQHPYVFYVHGQEYRVDYLPAESNTGMFGGNSNWRGPVWMPVNVMIIRALQNFYLYYGDNFKIECPTGSGQMMNLFEVSKEIADRLIQTFSRVTSRVDDPSTAARRSSRPIPTGAITSSFTSISTATTAPGWAPAIRPAGPGCGQAHPVVRFAGCAAVSGGGQSSRVREGCLGGRGGKNMKPWPVHPVIYEINTWVWLAELSQKYQRPVTLATVPPEEWDQIASFGFDAVWFMGVWQRSPAGIEISMRNQGLLEDFRRALPDFAAEDNVGSPYCVRGYVVDKHLGGSKGLAAARNELAARGLRLILDFVPNHVAPDHPWVSDHPEYFVQGNADEARNDPASFVETAGTVFARGRDPYFPAWPDVLQLNAFQPGLRQAVIATIAEIAGQCDGIRCDMAMLMLNDIFERTWGERAGAKPVDDYWKTVVSAIRTKWPEFRFMAEAYWDLEWELQQQGFDYCYDKKLYDRMEHGDAEIVRLHLLADAAYQQGMVRFIENHDEPRAAATFPDGKGRAAAVAILTLTGAKLLHEGQFEGRKVRLPVFLSRRLPEPVDQDLVTFYRHLLQEVNRDVFRSGEWRLCERSGWSDNQSCQNILAWCWVKEDVRYLIVMNYCDGTAQAHVQVPWDELRGKTWRLNDVLAGEIYDRSGDEMRDAGLYVDLGPWQCHLFQVCASEVTP